MGQTTKYRETAGRSRDVAIDYAELAGIRLPRRLGITGPPGCGKTTLARKLDRLALCTDGYLGRHDPARSIAVESAAVSSILVEGTLVPAACLRGLVLDELWILTRRPTKRSQRALSLGRSIEAAIVRLRASRHCPPRILWVKP